MTMTVSSYNLTIGEIVVFPTWSGKVKEIVRYKNSMMFLIEFIDGEKDRFKRGVNNGFITAANGTLFGNFIVDNFAKWQVED